MVDRPHALMSRAAPRGIVAEVTLFTVPYRQKRREEHLPQPSRNVNGTPAARSTRSRTPRNHPLTAPPG